MAIAAAAFIKEVVLILEKLSIIPPPAPPPVAAVDAAAPAPPAFPERLVIIFPWGESLLNSLPDLDLTISPAPSPKAPFSLLMADVSPPFLNKSATPKTASLPALYIPPNPLATPVKLPPSLPTATAPSSMYGTKGILRIFPIRSKIGAKAPAIFSIAAAKFSWASILFISSAFTLAAAEACSSVIPASSALL